MRFCALHIAPVGPLGLERGTDCDLCTFGPPYVDPIDEIEESDESSCLNRFQRVDLFEVDVTSAL